MADGNTVNLTRSSELRTWVETEPTKPEDEYTEGSSHQVVTWNSSTLAVAILTETRAKTDGTNQGEHTTYAMYDSRTCEIMEGSTECIHHERTCIGIAKPAATPCPVTFYWIDNQ